MTQGLPTTLASRCCYQRSRIDGFVGSGLIEFYAGKCEMGDARKVFDEMLVKDVVVWTSLIDGYGKNEDVESAGMVFDESVLTFNELQKLLGKTDGKVVGDLMTPAPLVVRETTNLEDAVRLLLETKYRRLQVVDVDAKLVGLSTRGDVVRASLKIKHAMKKMQLSQE